MALQPRLGVFGWPRRVLDLGLPLLESLSPAEFEAVLAHECTHLSKRHGRYALGLSRAADLGAVVRAVPGAGQVADRAARALSTLAKFIDWYWPRLNAYAFVLSRTNEYAADRSAAELAGKHDTASALWHIECLSRRLQDKFWPAMEQLANAQPQPPADFTGRMAAAWPPPAAADALRWTQRATQALTDNLDTHPSLSDRLRALGQPAGTDSIGRFPDVPRPSAAGVLLGERLDGIRNSRSALAAADRGDVWRRPAQPGHRVRHRLTTLERSPSAPSPTPSGFGSRRGPRPT